MTDHRPDTSLASSLRRARRRLALDQATLADLASVPLSTIEQVEQGEVTKLDAISAERLAGTLGISVKELLG